MRPFPACCFGLYTAALSQNAALYGGYFFAGVLASVLTFFSLGNSGPLRGVIVYGFSVALLVIYDQNGYDKAASGSGASNRQYRHWYWACGAASVIWIGYWIIWGVAPWEIAAAGLDQHYQLVTSARRYEWWVGWNMVDLIIFAGWPLMLGFFGALFLVFRRWRKALA